MFTSRPWLLGSTADESAWQEVAEAMDLGPASLFRPRQVHGATVAVGRAGEPPGPVAGGFPASRPEADIVISSEPAIGLAIQTADCVPLLIADRRTGAVGAAHAGWRGLAARVPIIAVEALVRELGSRPEDLLAAAGPSIGACCYEIGDEVRARFEQAGFGEGRLARWFVREPRPTVRNPSMPGLSPVPRARHWYLDGWTAAREQLESAAVPAEQIFLAEVCTASHQETLCSYRRDGKAAGRMAAAIRSARPRPSRHSPADPRAR
jgi:YfiH family protein